MEQITVIGASRGVGLETVRLAIEKGFKVIAFSRNLDNYPVSSPNLVLQRGDASSLADVEKAIKGSSAVVLAIGGAITLKKVTLYSKGTITLLNAMKKLKDNPLLIAVTGFGAGESKGHSGFLVNIFLGTLLRTGYKDKTEQEKLIKSSNTRWEIVRPAVLNDGELTGNYRVIDTLDVKPSKISRKDVADFILKQVDNPDHLNKTPLLTY
jgi:putative NADH-flavin reductase